MESPKLTELIGKISSEYTNAIDLPYKGHPLANYIRKEAPELIRKAMPQIYRDYRIEGSAGRGRWAERAWIAIFNPDVTEKASEGYYVAYLFPSNSTTLILGLCQSHDEAKQQYGKEFDVALTKQAELMRMKIPEFSDDFLSDNPSILSLGKLNYRYGHVYHKRYDVSQLPEESVLVGDLSKILDAYEALFYRGGRDSDSVEVYDAKSQDKDITIKERYKLRVHYSIERPSSSKIKRIKKKLGYICQACGFDYEGKYGELGKGYIEAHHLVPISELKKGEVRKTSEKDFAVLCSNCHRMIHKLSDPSDIEKLKRIIK